MRVSCQAHFLIRSRTNLLLPVNEEESAKYEKPTTIHAKIWDWLSKFQTYPSSCVTLLIASTSPNSVKIVVYSRGIFHLYDVNVTGFAVVGIFTIIEVFFIIMRLVLPT